MKEIVKKLLGYAIGIGILIALVFKIDFELFKVLITNLHWIFLLPLIFLRLVELFLGALNLKILLIAQKSIKIAEVVKYNIINFVGSTFLPLSAATLSIIYFLYKRNGIKPGISTSTIILDKSITFFLSLIVIFFAALKFFGIKTAVNVIYLGIIGIVVLYLMFYSKRTRKFIMRIVPKKYFSKLSGITTHFRMMFRNHKRLIIGDLLVTIVTLFVRALIIFFAFKTIGFNISIFDTLLIVNIAQLAVVFPITPGGLGVREAIGVYLFSLVGVPLTTTLTVYLLMIIMKFCLAAVFSMLIPYQLKKHDL